MPPMPTNALRQPPALHESSVQTLPSLHSVTVAHSGAALSVAGVAEAGRPVPLIGELSVVPQQARLSSSSNAQLVANAGLVRCAVATKVAVTAKGTGTGAMALVMEPMILSPTAPCFRAPQQCTRPFMMAHAWSRLGAMIDAFLSCVTVTGVASNASPAG